jgi:beta-glucosidase
MLGSLLSNLTQDEKDLIKESCDFCAIDGYTGLLGYGIEEGSAACAAIPVILISLSLREARVSLQMGSLLALLQTMVRVCWSAQRYTSCDKEVLEYYYERAVSDCWGHFVSEFGFAEPFEGDQTSLATILWDLRRADYYKGFWTIF